jgi:hypothetical protein
MTCRVSYHIVLVMSVELERGTPDLIRLQPAAGHGKTPGRVSFDQPPQHLIPRSMGYRRRASLGARVHCLIDRCRAAIRHRGHYLLYSATSAERKRGVRPLCSSAAECFLSASSKHHRSKICGASSRHHAPDRYVHGEATLNGDQGKPPCQDEKEKKDEVVRDLPPTARDRR